MAPPTSRRHRLSGGQRRVMQDIIACRTAALGGQLAQCDHCGAQVIRYHSCQNRHCPKCQTLAKVRWVEARLRDLLPIPYFHCVFTLPHALNPLAQGNPRLLYGLLFQTAAATLQTFGRDPKWLGGELGITMVLHTWSQTLEHHIHVHCVVTGGALAPEGDRWIPTKRRDFLFPVKALSRVFRGKYLTALQERLCAGPPPVCRVHSAPGGRPDLPAFPRTAVAAALGRLCQAALCLGAARPLVPGPLYASRGAQQ